VKVLEELKKIKKTWDDYNKGWRGIVIYSLLGVIIAFSVHQGFGLILGTQLPIVTVSSGSMVPTLNVGDIVFIKGENTYQLGDIIVFKGWEPEPIIHRIVAYSDGNIVKKYDGWNELTDERIKELAQGKEKIYITKGDHNPACDQCGGRLPPTDSKIYGKSILVVPYLGWVKILFVEYFIKDPVIGIAIVIILGLGYWAYKKWM